MDVLSTSSMSQISLGQIDRPMGRPNGLASAAVSRCKQLSYWRELKMVLQDSDAVWINEAIVEFLKVVSILMIGNLDALPCHVAFNAHRFTYLRRGPCTSIP